MKSVLMSHGGALVGAMAGFALASAACHGAPVAGAVTPFVSPGGVQEQCIRIEDFPGALYSPRDRETEAAYCALDVWRLALCPKLWSTSPGTLLYEIDADKWSGDYARFEREHCGRGHHTAAAAMAQRATFKVSVNEPDTSATYAPASWVYYHLSRYFRTGIHVPVAVYRSIDASLHHKRVVEPALAAVAGRHGLGMLEAGWRLLDAVETGEREDRAAHAVLTDDGRQVYGVLLSSEGDRYGAEVNGTRESGWGAGQNHDFQQTAPFLALRSDKPVREAALAAIEEARRNPLMAKALRADTPVEQVVFWMQDVLEITLLDYILGQQDRIGNIDYNWRWYWLEQGELRSAPALGKTVPGDLRDHRPVRLRQSALNDNDAGVRRGYVDFAQKTHMLEGLRHYNAALYRRLGLLAADLAGRGPAYRWLVESAGLSAKEADSIASRAIGAFELLQADCRRGTLQLDLDPAQVLDAAPAAGGEAGPGACVIDGA